MKNRLLCGTAAIAQIGPQWWTWDAWWRQAHQRWLARTSAAESQQVIDEGPGTVTIRATIPA